MHILILTQLRQSSPSNQFRVSNHITLQINKACFSRRENKQSKHFFPTGLLWSGGFCLVCLQFFSSFHFHCTVNNSIGSDWLQTLHFHYDNLKIRTILNDMSGWQLLAIWRGSSMNCNWTGQWKKLSGNINGILSSLESSSVHVRYSKTHIQQVWYQTGISLQVLN